MLVYHTSVKRYVEALIAEDFQVTDGVRISLGQQEAHTAGFARSVKATLQQLH